jgi:hypothetical protein
MAHHITPSGRALAHYRIGAKCSYGGGEIVHGWDSEDRHPRGRLWLQASQIVGLRSVHVQRAVAG